MFLSELLAIEDSLVQLSIIRRIAAQEGFATTGATCAEGAAQLLRQRTYDCITLDLNLGEQSGNDVLQVLSDLKCRTPLLIVSGEEERAREIAARAGKMLGLDVRLPFGKPVDLPALRTCLKRIASLAERERRLRAVAHR